MENGLIPMSGGFNLRDKVSWDKPEGKLGTVVAILGGSALVFGFIKLLPILTAIAWNFVSFTIAIFVGICLIFMLFSKEFWNTISVGYLVLMHKLLYSIIQNDPVAILDDYIKQLGKQIVKVDEAIKNFRGLIEKNKARLKDTEEKLQNNIAKKKAYEKRGETAFAGQIDQLIVMYESTLKSRQERLEVSEKWMDALDKVRTYAKFSVKTNKEKIAIFKEQYEEAKEAAKATKSLKKAVNGDPDLVGNFELAMSIMEKQMSENIGEVEDMLRATTGLLNEADLENAVASEKANSILSRYDKKEGVFSEDSWKALPNNGGERIITLSEDAVKVRPSNNSDNNKYFE